MKRLLTRLVVAGVAWLAYGSTAHADPSWTYTTVATPLAVAPDSPGGGLVLTSQSTPSAVTAGTSGIVATTVLGSTTAVTDHYTNAPYQVAITVKDVGSGLSHTFTFNGEFSGTLDVLRSGIVEESGISRIGIAGHPEGHNAVATALLWEALQAKQAFAERAGMRMHIVTQFGISGGAFESWERELVRRRIRLPVRVGIAGPAPIAKLLHFAIQCGIGASVRGLMRTLGTAVHSPELALSPDQHLLGVLATPVSAQIVAPHFFAFGGALETARWMRKVAAGAFDIDLNAARFRMLG